MILSKVCSRCKEEKDCSQFYKKKRRSGTYALHSYCKSCVKEDSRRTYLEARGPRLYPEERTFDDMIDRMGECWIWRGRTDLNGLPIYQKDNTKSSVRRLVYEKYVGELSSNNQVRSRCKNKKCVSPNHLYVTTRK